MNALFQFEDRSIQPIETQRNIDRKAGQLFEKFKNKATLDMSPFDLNDFIFTYNGEKIDKDTTIAQLKGNKSSSFIIISVKKKTKIMKCPECISNTCFIQIENYGLKFSGCRYNHNIEKNFIDYEKTQKIDYDQIKCDKCRKTQRTELKDFYKCLKCSEEFKRSSYFCEECIKSHSKDEGEVHKYIKYDDKYYLCSKHSNEFCSYCAKCKCDLCDICEKNHKGKEHDIIKYDTITPKIKLIKKDLEDIRKRTAKAKTHIDQLKKMIEDAFSALDSYYNISMDLIEKYELYNSRLRNYHVIKTINHLQISNKKITDDLNQIIIGNKSKSDYLNKCKVLIDIFVSDKERYIGGIAVENKYMENNEASSQNVIANANDNYIEKIQVETKNSEDNQNSSSQNGSFSKKKKK